MFPLNDRSVDHQLVGRSINRSIGWSVDRSVDYSLSCWSVDWVRRSICWSTRSVDQSVDGSVGWSVGRSVGRSNPSVGRSNPSVKSVGRSIGRSIGSVGRSSTPAFSSAILLFTVEAAETKMSSSSLPPNSSSSTVSPAIAAPATVGDWSLAAIYSRASSKSTHCAGFLICHAHTTSRKSSFVLPEVSSPLPTWSICCSSFMVSVSIRKGRNSALLADITVVMT